MDPLRSVGLNNLITNKKSKATPESIPKSRSSGKVSSLQRQWSLAQPKLQSQSQPQPQPQSSSQPSWQADESEWPPSPPSKKLKSAGNLSFNNAPSKSTQRTLTSSGSVIRYPPSAQINFRGPQSNQNSSTRLISTSSAPKPANNLKRNLPWEVTRNPKANSLSSKPSTAFDQLVGIDHRQAQFTTKSHLNNPNMSIAAKVSLSPEQQDVLDSVLKGNSVFFTGSAGTGKSVLLRHIISALKRSYASRADCVAITASTGMAACAIGGTTIHSFAGIGLGLESPDQLVNKVKKNRKASGKWMRTKVLIIDEISMVDGELFDKLAYIAQKIKRSDKPFGGIQLVIAGDFFQLPPVSKGRVSFAFNAKQWAECIPTTVNLTQVFRQKDSTFIDMLNEMRMGELSAASIQRFKQLSRELNFGDGIAPTELYPTRNEVERSNAARLNAIKTPEEIYIAADSGKAPPEQRERDLANLMAVPRLVLKKDAQVMMIKNQVGEDGPSWLVNGVVGRILDFVDSDTTLDAYHLKMVKDSNVNFDGFFSDEEDFKPLDVKPSPHPPLKGKAINQTVEKKADDLSAGTRSVLPVVEWFLMGGKREITIVEKAEFKVENMEGEVQSRRIQLPLILAWAMSIHKSQGQTLNRVKVDLGKVFEKGQIYVALSRATSLDGLQVLRFDPKKVMAHPEVIKWSKENLISRAEEDGS